VRKFGSTDAWNREIDLCTRFLGFDARNFHCWDYRRIAAASAAVPDISELEFTMKKLEENFSNYSAWHYRSALLERGPQSDASAASLSSETALQELELVQQASFTEPADQSAWFYRRWLLAQHLA
jgi:geranylgeranyl transferase type-2 subunit alpha